MKKTIWNASLEESMNLVTDKYIQASMKDINENGYRRKILGFFTVLFFQFLVERFGLYMDSQGVHFLSISSALAFRILLFCGCISVLLYLVEIRKIKHNRILSYYIYNTHMFIMMTIFGLQLILFSIIGSSMVGGIFSYLIYGLLYVVLILERVLSFRKGVHRTLYQQEEFRNPLYDFLEKFIAFSKKYGGIVLIILILFRFFFSKATGSSQQNDLLRAVGLFFFPLVMIIQIYFIDAMASENFQGYYLKKYLEDYRQFGDYSLEDWYGKKSKVYKEKMKNRS